MPSCLTGERHRQHLGAERRERDRSMFRQKASARRDAVNRYLWDDKTASTAITTGDASNWRCFPLRHCAALCRYGEP